MKITDIDADSKLILKFKYNEKPYSMNVSIVAKNSEYIIIPAVLQNDLVIDPSTFVDFEIIFSTKEGIFQYQAMKLDANIYMGMRVYYISSDEDIQRSNRREAFRVFFGEIVNITVISENGRKKNIEGILKDLSVTGMGVIAKQELEIGAMLKIVYNYDGLYFLLQGKIIRKEKVFRYRAFSYGCEFKEPNNSINRIIILKQLRSKKENNS